MAGLDLAGVSRSLAAARDKHVSLDEPARRATIISLGIPTFREIPERTVTLAGN